MRSEATEPVDHDAELWLEKPLAQMTEPWRSQVEDWLRAHAVDPMTLVVAHPIVRDPDLGKLSWHCTAPDGGVQQRLVYRGSTPLGEWPAPFPCPFELDVDPDD